jgi:hypothetical protein
MSVVGKILSMALCMMIAFTVGLTLSNGAALAITLCALLSSMLVDEVCDAIRSVK